MADAHKNFAYSTVAVAPTPAASGVTLDVAAGTGTLFPAVPFNATVWPTGVQPTAANAEIVRVTNIATDTFTVTRTQESTSARTVIVGDQIAATVTAKTLTDVEAPTALSIVGTTAPQLTVGYDGSNYLTASTSSDGITTFNAVGSSAAAGFIFNDPISIGGYTTQAAIGLNILFGAAFAKELAGTQQYGIVSQSGYGSDATVSGTSGYFSGGTTAASYTMTNLYGLFVGAGVKGAGSTITNQYGLYIEDQALGGTLNYAIYTNAGAVRFGGAVTCASTLTIGASSLLAETGNGLEVSGSILYAASGFRVGSSGNAGFGVSSGAGAYITVAAGTTSRASINMASGSAPTSPSAGDFWYETGVGLRFRDDGGTTRTITWT